MNRIWLGPVPGKNVPAAPLSSNPPDAAKRPFRNYLAGVAAAGALVGLPLLTLTGSSANGQPAKDRFEISAQEPAPSQPLQAEAETLAERIEEELSQDDLNAQDGILIIGEMKRLLAITCDLAEEAEEPQSIPSEEESVNARIEKLEQDLQTLQTELDCQENKQTTIDERQSDILSRSIHDSLLILSTLTLSRIAHSLLRRKTDSE